MTSGEENVKGIYLHRIKVNCKWQKIESIFCTFFLSGYALDPSLDNHQVATKYIGSVEEAEKNQGNLFEIIYTPIITILQIDFRQQEKFSILFSSWFCFFF